MKKSYDDGRRTQRDGISSPESFKFGRKHETWHMCTIGPKDQIKKRPQKIGPPGGRHLGFKYGRRLGQYFCYIFKTKPDRKENSRSTPTFPWSGNPMRELPWKFDVGHIGIQDGRHFS